MIQARYLVRLDDACPTMDWARWGKMERLLDAYDVKPMVGVIPDNKDATFHIDPPRVDFWETVAQWHRKGWVVGFHGHQHVYVTRESGLVPINKKSEFAGLSLDVQKDKIRKGWQIFSGHGVKPKVWIAPGHSFDENTLLALKNETDINIVSDGIALKCFASDGFFWVPQQLWRFRNMLFGTYTICFHPNSMTDRGFQRLKCELDKHQKSFITLSDIDLSRVRPRGWFDKLLTTGFSLRSRAISQWRQSVS